MKDKHEQTIDDDEKIAFFKAEIKRLETKKKYSKPKFKRPPEAITKNELEKLITKCSKRYPTGLRNAALLSVGFYGGLRISEALDLKEKDIDFEGGQIHILHGVNGRDRMIFFPIEHFSYMLKWLDMKKQMGIDDDSPIFCTITNSEALGIQAGSPLKTSYVRRLMKRLARKAKLKKRISFYGLRHGCTLEYRKKGVDIPNIQDMLGHSRAATTMDCVANIYPKNLKNACRKVW